MNRIFLLAFGCVALAVASYGQSPAPATTRTAVFVGGCFWCIQPAFDKTPGVIKTVVGYCGGTEPNPSYKLVPSSPVARGPRDERANETSGLACSSSIPAEEPFGRVMGSEP